ncbi:hypothetical protein [Faecalibacterium sp. 9]|uniref:hypothetical protein n=1 Tax=Faecalibacterium sp. 9 TaxID=3402018 RepID=UPI003AAE84AC
MENVFGAERNRVGAGLRLMLALSATRQPQADSSNMPFTATTPPREKANQENPQIFLICKYKNNFSAIIAKANAAAIPNRCCSVYTSHLPCARMKPTNQRR